MALGSNHVTTTTGDVFRPEIWSMEVLRATEEYLVAAPLVKRFDSLVANKGDNINIPSLSNLTAYSKSASTSLTLSAPTETNTQLSIDQHYYAGVLIEDIVKVQSNYDLMKEYTSKAAYAISEKIDTGIMAEYSNFTNNDVGTYGVDVTDAVILSAMEALDLAKAPLKNRAFVIYPTQKTALLKLDKFVKADYVGEYDQATKVARGPNSEYLWGDIYGVPTYYTTQISQTAATPTQTHNVMFHKECIALALQQAPRTQNDYILEYLGNLVVVDAIWGIKTLRGDFGVEVRS